MAKNVETVAGRSVKLTQVLLGKAGNGACQLTREGLLDAFLTLYDECNNESLKKDRNVASFLEKFRETILELRRLQVNIGDFEVKKIIGRGHYGEVNLVREKQTSNVYAMKKIHKSLTTDKNSESFYEKERDIMVKASSPWITRLQYSFHDTHYLYLIMEFHAGGDMLSLMERSDSAFPEENAQFYLTEMVLAVHSVHNMGYVHRDIKPDNILLDRSGHIKLADFGSAARLNDQQLVTSKIPVGTPDYIAPEVLSSVNGGGKLYGVGCDWWSVGIVFYEMLFANTPFNDKTTLGTYSKILNFKVSLSIPEGASKAAVSVLRGLLAEDGERFGYNELHEHPYFEGMNWTSIREGQAPFVPNISGQEDTSHFDDFEHEPSPPSVESFRQKKDFSGKGLPYIGFTYNACLGLHPDRSNLAFCVSPGRETGQSIEHQLFLKKKEHGELQKKFLALRAYEAALRGQVVTSQGKMTVLEKRKDSLEEELQQCHVHLRGKDTELENIRRLLVLEREQRVNAEKRAVTLVQAMHLKYNEYERLQYVKERLLDDTCSSVDILNQAIYEDDSTLKEEPVSVIHMSGDSKQAASTSTSDLPLEMKMSREVEETVKALEIELRNTTQKLEESQEKYLQVVQRLSQESDGKLSSTRAEELLLETKTRKEAEKMVQSLETELQNTTHNLEESKEKYLQLLQEFNTMKSKMESESIEVHRLLLEIGNGKKVEVEFQTRVQELESQLQEALAEQARKVEELEGIWGAEKRLRLEAELRLQERDTSLQEKLKCTEQQLQEVSAAKDKQENQVALLEEKIAEDQLAISQLEKKLENMASIEEKSESPEKSPASVSGKVSELEEKIKGLRSNQSDDRSKYFELRNTLRVKERELSEARLDLRLAQKEAKQLEAALEEARVLREKLARTEEEHARCPTREAVLQERVATLQAEADAQSKLRQGAETKLSEMRDKYEEILLQQSRYEKEAAAKIQMLEALKTACARMDEQLKTYETIVEENQENTRKAVIQKHNLELALEAKGKEIKLLEEKIHRVKLERQDLVGHHMSRLEEERRRMVNSGEEATSLRAELKVREGLEAELRKKLSEAEEQASQLALAKLRTEQLAEEMEFASVQIKEEASRHITALASLKRSNVDLQEVLDLRTQQVEVMREELESLQSDLDTQKVHYETELTKSKEQIQQLNKLIYHLQSSSTNEKKKSKWPFVFRSGGAKSTRDLPIKENRRSQMRRRENEMHDIQKKNQPPETPSKGSEDSSETSSVASRGSHALEEVTRGFGILPCVVCRKLTMVTKMVSCQDCGASCHRHCQSELPNDCGHRSENVRRRRTIRHQMTFHIQRGEYASWVRMPRRKNAGWERRHLSLKDGLLYVHQTGSPADTPLLRFDLRPHEDVVVVKEATLSAEAIQNPSEANLVLEIFSPSHPTNEMCFMVSNVEEKFKWLEVLEGVVQPHLEKNRKVLDIKALDSLVLTLEKENLLDLRCCAILSNEVLLLGAEEGLYYLDRRPTSKEALLRISQQSIHTISLLTDARVVIIILGKDRWLYWVPESAMHQHSGNQSLFMHQMANLRDCQALSTRGSVVAAATSKAIRTWQWTTSKGSFTLLQEIMTSQPCVTLHVGESVLFYATDSIHGVGLHHSAEGKKEVEVPDALYVFAKGVLQQQKKGPVAIFGTRGGAYLVCFPAVGILLDGAGNQKQIKWTQAPHSFAYEGSHLFVTYQNRVEVIEIDHTRDNIRGRWTYVTARKPQLLGTGSKGDFYVSTVCGSELNIQRVDASVALDAVLLDIDGPNKSSTNSDGDFSFTSSIIDTLDASDQLGETRTLDSVGREASM